MLFILFSVKRPFPHRPFPSSPFLFPHRLQLSHVVAKMLPHMINTLMFFNFNLVSIRLCYHNIELGFWVTISNIFCVLHIIIFGWSFKYSDHASTFHHAGWFRIILFTHKPVCTLPVISLFILRLTILSCIFCALLAIWSQHFMVKNFGCPSTNNWYCSI